jgi:ABC-type nickel/cobalt efflux system permease component RcnA
MKANSEKHEDIEQYELDALKEIKEKMFERNEENERHAYIAKGLVLGLTYGISGTLFVLFVYPLVEAVLLGEYSAALLGNLIVCAISVIAIVFVSLYLRRDIARDKNKQKISKESVDVIEYAIKRRQYALEQRKKETASQYQSTAEQRKT